MVFASDFEGEPDLLDGVMGKGIAKSCSFRLVGEDDAERVGDRERVGELGISSIVLEDGDLGDDAARILVSVDAFTGVGNTGRSANGKLGIGDSTALSCKHPSQHDPTKS